MEEKDERNHLGGVVPPVIYSEGNSSVKESQDESASELGLSPDLTRKQRKILLQEREDQKEEERRQREDDEFSQSFYGPIYSDQGASVEDSEEELEQYTLTGEPGYRYVSDTHGKRKGRNQVFVDDDFSNKVRWLVLTYRGTLEENKKQRIPLHRAALNGDKHFCQMMVKEAAKMEVNVLDDIIDLPDVDQLTPLYMLCEKGYRRAGEGGDDDSDMENEKDLGTAKVNALGIKLDVSHDGGMDQLEASLDDRDKEDFEYIKQEF